MGYIYILLDKFAPKTMVRPSKRLTKVLKLSTSQVQQ